jgi:hypothetical protein
MCGLTCYKPVRLNLTGFLIELDAEKSECGAHIKSPECRTDRVKWLAHPRLLTCQPIVFTPILHFTKDPIGLKHDGQSAINSKCVKLEISTFGSIPSLIFSGTGTRGDPISLIKLKRL